MLGQLESTGSNPIGWGSMKNMKVWIIGLVVSCVFALGLVGIVGIGAAPVRGETQWRELYETTGLTWAQVAAVCPQDGATPCAGSIGGIDLTGWVWATSDQVLSLLDDHQPLLSTANPYLSGPDQFGAAAGFLSEMRWTSYLSLTYLYQESTYGWTASTDGAGLPIAGGASFQYPIFGGSIGLGAGADGADRTRGVFLWRIGSPPPAPTAAATTTTGAETTTTALPAPPPETTTTVPDDTSTTVADATTTTTAPTDETTTTTTAPLPEVVGDESPPVIRVTVNGSLGSNGWYTSNVNVVWDVTDDQSPLASTDGCYPTSFAADTDAVTMTCTASSEGVPGASTRSVVVKRDATVPAVACAAAPAFALDSIGAQVIATVTDAMSGPANPTLAVAVTTSAPGRFHALFVGADQAGNAASGQCPFTVVATCAGLTPTIVGTPGNDTIRGTNGRDIIHGLDGADTIVGRDGNDVICGGEGNDTLEGDDGNDQIDGGGGRDTIRGGRGVDTCASGEIRMSSC